MPNLGTASTQSYIYRAGIVDLRPVGATKTISLSGILPKTRESVDIAIGTNHFSASIRTELGEWKNILSTPITIVGRLK